MWSLFIKLGVPLLKFFYEQYQGKKISDKEFGELVTKHMEDRSGAGQTVLDGEDSIADLESRIPKKKKDS